MTAACPCCGAPVEGAVSVEALLAIQFGPVRSTLLRCMIEAYPRPRSARQIADYVYRDDPDGGPDGALDLVSINAHHIRKKIEPLGWTLRGVRGRGNSLYFLSPIAEPSK